MITDEMLRSSAARSSELFAHTIASDYNPVQQYEPSDLFEKKIRKLFHRAKHPYFYKAIQRIASIFLAAILIGSMYLAIDTEARAKFLGWVKEIYAHYLVYHYEGDAVNVANISYHPTWLPDGYTKVYENESKTTSIIIYADDMERMLKLYYAHNSSEIDWFVDMSHCEVTSTTISNVSAELLIASDSSTASSIIWVDENHTVFYLSAFLSEDDLIKVAESIQPSKS